MDWADIKFLFLAVWFGIIGYFVSRYVRHGGFSAALFGARIQRTVGEVESAKALGMRSVLKIHVLEAEPGQAPLVGLSEVTKGFASRRLTVLKLTPDQAKLLALLLNQAAVG